MKKKNLIIGLLVSLAIVSNIQAQEKIDSAYLEIPTRGRGFQVTFEGGKMNFTNTKGDYDYNGGHFYGVLGYKINKKISTGIGLGFDAVEMSYQGGIQSLKLNNTTGETERNISWLSEDLGVFKLFARGQYRFTDNRFSPFVACDLGIRCTISGYRDMYGESLLFDEDNAWKYGTYLEEYKAGSLTQLLGKPSVVNVFATPTIGFSLRTTNNSYLELKAGYTLSPYAMGVRKSTDYTFNNEQITHIASCRPIKMSAPFVSLAFTHTFGVWSDLDESLYEATKARTREKWENALVITGAVLGAAATVAGTISTAQNNNSEKIGSTSMETNNSKAGTGKKDAKAKPEKYNIGVNISGRGSERAYSNYIEMLHKMTVYPETYNAQDRKRYQAEMRKIRENHNSDESLNDISKSPWEDWDGDLNSHS